MPTIASRCELEVERGPDWLLVRIKDLDEQEAEVPSLADELWELLERHLTYRLVLEMDQLTVLSSRLVGQLVELKERIQEHDGVMRLCGISPQNLRVLRSCRLDRPFLPYQDREEAVMAGRHRHWPR